MAIEPVSLLSLFDPVNKLIILLQMLHQLISKKLAELGHIPLGGGIGGEHLQDLPRGDLAHRGVEHHDGFRAQQPAGIQSVV